MCTGILSICLSMYRSQKRTLDLRQMWINQTGIKPESSKKKASRITWTLGQLTFKWIWFGFRAFLLQQFLAPFLNFLIPVYDVLLEGWKDATKWNENTLSGHFSTTQKGEKILVWQLQDQNSPWLVRTIITLWHRNTYNSFHLGKETGLCLGLIPCNPLQALMLAGLSTKTLPGGTPLSCRAIWYL